ncbi:MAG: T9SS type A sorting domain-containing protein, partial [Bacteroidales bacterium]
TVGPLKPGFIPSRIQFINLSGQIIDYTLPQATTNQNNHVIINTSQLPTGLYWVLLSNETEQVGGKLLIYR